MNSAVIVACMLIQDDDVEPVYTELKRENEEDKSKIIYMYMTLCCLCITKQEYVCVHTNYEMGDYKVQLAAKYIRKIWRFGRSRLQPPN